MSLREENNFDAKIGYTEKLSKGGEKRYFPFPENNFFFTSLDPKNMI